MRKKSWRRTSCRTTSFSCTVANNTTQQPSAILQAWSVWCSCILRRRVGILFPLTRVNLWFVDNVHSKEHVVDSFGEKQNFAQTSPFVWQQWIHRHVAPPTLIWDMGAGASASFGYSILKTDKLSCSELFYRCLCEWPLFVRCRDKSATAYVAEEEAVQWRP